MVVVSTASPFKFCNAVLEGIGETGESSGLAALSKLESVTGLAAPKPLSALRSASVRFADSVEKEQMNTVVEQFLAGR